MLFDMVKGKPLIPTLFFDSLLKVGNSNNLPTIIKTNFPPYGRYYIQPEDSPMKNLP